MWWVLYVGIGAAPMGPVGMYTDYADCREAAVRVIHGQW
jgi:hypothetical protein